MKSEKLKSFLKGIWAFARMFLCLNGDEISNNAVKLEVNKRCRQVGHGTIGLRATSNGDMAVCRFLEMA